MRFIDEQCEVPESITGIDLAKYFTTMINNRFFTPGLTKREIEVIGLILEELTSEEIADRLFVSTHTVESHRKNIASKLAVKNVVGIVKYAFESGIVGLQKA